MLKKGARLRAAEVEDALRRGKPLRGRYLSAKVLQNSSGTMRYAAVVQKKLAKGAVGRNRARRALYRALQALDIGPRQSYNAVLFVRVLPPLPLTPAFREDLEGMFRSLLP